jgi:4-hydroxybenzoate polyprenyltransferase
VTRPRSRAHIYLRLARVSNLPTVWTNVLAGMIVAGASFNWSLFLHSAIAVSLLYTAGMFLNDAFDRDFDAVRNRARPIPSGEIAASEVFAAGWVLLAAGLLLLVAGARSTQAFAWSLPLAAAIVYYDYRHKRDRLGPLVMALCRGLVYFVAAAAATGFVQANVMMASLVLTAYVLGVTLVAKWTGPEFGWLIALLIAGISFVDATFIAVAGHPGLALAAACGFGLTLLGQRFVSGV